MRVVSHGSLVNGAAEHKAIFNCYVAVLTYKGFPDCVITFVA